MSLLLQTPPPSAGTTFGPPDQTNLTLWIDGADSSTMTLSGSHITAIKDKSPNAITLTGSTTAPTLAAASLNGRSTIAFGGSANFTNGSVVSGIVNMGTAGYDIFAMVLQSNLSLFPTFLVLPTEGSGLTAYNWAEYAATSGYSWNNGTVGGTNGYNVTGYTFSTSSFYGVHWGYNGGAVTVSTNFQLDINNGTPATINAGGPTGLNNNEGIYIGSWPTGFNLVGNIAEILVYQTNGHAAAVAAYFTSKWGIA